VDPAGYAEVAARLADRFPRLRTIAFTQRGSVSASENTWSGVAWTPDAFHVARSYRIAPVVDRVGAGDSFAAGLIYGLLDGRRTADALEFAVAASCLKHSIRGDVAVLSVAEVEALAAGSGSGRVER
jgi:2-dehydro-3-deoxygluconokinase